MIEILNPQGTRINREELAEVERMIENEREERRRRGI